MSINTEQSLVQHPGHPPRIVFLIDTSSSMHQYIQLIEEKLEHLATALKNSSYQHVLGTSSFSDRYYGVRWEEVHVSRNGGNTFLYGSCVALIQELSRSFTAQDKTLIVVITDGHDSGSGDRNLVAREVGVAEEILGWDFLFVGTNINAYKVGAGMGVKPSKTLGFANSNSGFEAMLDSLTDISTRWLAGAIAHNDTFFSQDVRSEQEAMGAIRFE